MKWKKSRLIYRPEIQNKKGFTHASIPFVQKLAESSIRVFFSSRNEEGLSLPFWVDLDPNRSFSMIDKSDVLLPLGDLGTFDDCGIMPSWVTTYEGRHYLYYIGWNPQVSVSYRLSIGLAISENYGKNFKKYSIGPICDRTLDEPFFNTAPCVIFENDTWRMWYISCTGWSMINNHPEPQYHVKYASSSDGIHWDKKGHVCIDYNEKMESIGRPAVIKVSDIYLMFFSYRMVKNYRSDPLLSYKIGLAKSKDGLEWKITHTPLIHGEVLSDWDEQMQEYCYPLILNDELFLFYNGNGFGKSGIGYTSVPLKDLLGEIKRTAY